MSPKVTIMMAVFNADKYLRQAMESALAQSFTDFELLIAYDPSSDRSLDIIRSYSDSRIRILQGTAARGLTDARKRALEASRGEYIAILDPDDIAFRKRLETQVNYLESHPEVGAVGSACEIIDENGQVERCVALPTEPLTLRWKLLFGNCIYNSTSVFRRQTALDLGGYDEKVTAGEDFNLWIRFAAYSKIANLVDPVGQWRRHPTSAGHTEPASAKDQKIEIVIRSVQKQTGLIIGYEVARTLFRDMPKPAPNALVFRYALDTVEMCLRCFINNTQLNRYERRKLISLAMEDILRLGCQSPAFIGLTCFSALRFFVRFGPVFIKREILINLIKTIANRLFPRFVLSRLKLWYRGRQLLV